MSLRIVYEDDGFPREILDAPGLEHAISSESLTPDMLITVYRADADPQRLPARELPELRDLFGLNAPPAQPEPAAPLAGAAAASSAIVTPGSGRKKASAPPPPAPAPLAETPWAGASPSTPFSSPGLLTSLPGGLAASDYISPTSPDWPQTYELTPGSLEPGFVDKPRKVSPLAIFALVIIGIWGVGTCASRMNRSVPGSSTINTTTTSTLPESNSNMMGSMGDAEPMAETEGPAFVSGADLAASSERYLVRQTNVRQKPAAAARLIASLNRGAQLSGVTVSSLDGTSQWIKITRGPHAGYFVALSNLADAPRPSLDTSYSGRMTLYASRAVFAEPAYGSTVRENLAAGALVQVVGMGPNGFAEVALSSGGIGYIDSSGFETNNDGDAGPEDRDEDVPASNPPPERQPGLPTRPNLARASELLSGSVNNSDYPSDALRASATGTTVVRLLIDRNGGVADCSVVQSAGNGSLDRRTCQVMNARFRFRPALDANGAAIDSYVTRQIRWTMQD